MNHAGTQLLESDRLILRRFVIEDNEAMYQNWASDPEVTKYLTWPVHESPEASKGVLEEWIALYEKPDYYQWAITLKEYGDIPIGSISVVQQNERVEMVQIGYCIGQNWWRQGIMSEALNTVIHFFFDTVNANRVEAFFDPRNENSGKVMKKCGMTYEGTLRQTFFNNQGICDASYYGILKRDIL